MTLTAGQTSVVRAILGATSTRHLRLSMLVGSHLESSWTPKAVGDGSYGAFQIQLTAHPGVTVAEAETPTWATNFMLGTYRTALGEVSATLWHSTPERASEQVADKAERPLRTYYTGRASTVTLAYNDAVTVLNTAKFQATTSTPRKDMTAMVIIRNKTTGAAYLMYAGKTIGIENATTQIALNAATVKTAELSGTDYTTFTNELSSAGLG